MSTAILEIFKLLHPLLEQGLKSLDQNILYLQVQLTDPQL